MERNKKRLLTSIILNFFIVLFEIIGAILSIKRRGVEAFLFYTEISNYLTLVISLIYVISAIIVLNKNKKVPNIVVALRYLSNVCLLITLTVVVTILIPMTPSSTAFYLFGDSNLYQHFLCPILTFVSFMFFENERELNKRIILLGMFPTLAYGLILISLNFCKLIVGPYPFFYVYDMPWYVIILFLLGILLATYFISFLTRTIYNKIYRKQNKILNTKNDKKI